MMDNEIDNADSLPRKLIKTKLRPHMSCTPVLNRQHVLSHLSASPIPTLTLLSAPAGYGKTTTLLQWREQLLERGYIVAWLSLDSHDSDPATFLAYLIASINEAGLPMHELNTVALSKLEHTSVEAVFPLVVSSILDAPTPLFLFFDDYQLASCRIIDSLMAELIAYLQGEAHVVLSTRNRPSINVAKLRAMQDIRELGTENLKFDRDECIAFFGYHDEETGNLMNVAEGWPVAMQLARLWLQGRTPSAYPSANKQFDGRAVDLTAYLMEEVFSNLSGPLQDIILRVSVFERFNVDLINAVCEFTEGWAFIESLQLENLFITALDDENYWYSLHQLFRDFSTNRLLRVNPSEFARLNARAANWFQECGYIESALLHAQRSGDSQLLEQILKRAGGWMVALREGAQVLEGLMAIDLKIAVKHPAIALAQTYVFLQKGEIRKARRLYSSLVGSHKSSDPSVNGQSEISTQILKNIILLYEDEPLVLEEITEIRFLLGNKNQTDLSECELIGSLECYACYQYSQYENCIDIGKRTFRRFIHQQAFYGAVFLSCYIGLAQRSLGRLSEAEETFDYGLRIASDHYSVHSNQVAMVRVLCAETAYERNELDSAWELLSDSFKDFRQTGGWYEILAPGITTRTSIMAREGNIDDALEFLDFSEQYSRERALPRLQLVILIQRLWILVRYGRVSQALKLAAETAFHDFVAKGEPSEVRASQLRNPALVLWARLLGEMGEVSDATRLLAHLAENADESGHLRLAIQSRITLAIIENRNFEQQKAFANLGVALEKAESSGFVSVFLDEGDEVLELIRGFVEAPGNQSRKVLEWAQLILSAARARVRTEEIDSPGTRVEKYTLSAREEQVLDLLSKGLSTKEMSKELKISEGTVKVHRKRLYRRLGVHRRSAALSLARANKLLH